MSLTFIIEAPAYDKNVGGFCALHYLADCLHGLGVDQVYITTGKTNPRWYALTIDKDKPFFLTEDFVSRLYKALVLLKGYVGFTTFKRKINRLLARLLPKILWRHFARNTTVVVYAEAVRGNPLGAKHVVRWILNDPGVCGGDGIFGENDHIFLYHALYKVEEKYKVQGVLTAIDLRHHLNTFTKQNFSERKSGAYLVRKGGDKVLDKHPPEFIRADEFLNSCAEEEAAHFFNQIETFVSYDHMTFISIQAALCGCNSIIIPGEGKYRKENLIKTNRINGVAYGFEDMDWAKSTQHLLRPHLEKLNAENMETVRRFKEYCDLKIANWTDTPP